MGVDSYLTNPLGPTGHNFFYVTDVFFFFYENIDSSDDKTDNESSYFDSDFESDWEIIDSDDEGEQELNQSEVEIVYELINLTDNHFQADVVAFHVALYTPGIVIEDLPDVFPHHHSK